jgi:peptidoglycan/LPS O-acetylase OafA/YrhL
MGLGFYRFVLAAAVIVEHLAEGTRYVSHTGMFAVFGFYVLSGYLITRVLNDVYDFAFVPFWSNRFLRLYPPYFMLLGVGLVLVLGTKEAATFFPAVWKSRPETEDYPDDFSDGNTSHGLVVPPGSFSMVGRR